MGATHHVTVRGNARSVVAVDDVDYAHALHLLERMESQFQLRCHAWCYLPNHSHLLVTSELRNLSKAMHWLGTCTAMAFNRRHQRTGHVYQGRFHSKLVKDDRHLLALARYLPLNPVRAALCESAKDWKWSSYAATAGLLPAPRFLDTKPLIHLLGSRNAYVSWVDEGMLATSLDDDGLPKAPPRPELAELLADTSDRAIADAHFRHGHTISAISRHLGISRDQVRRRMKAAT